jgi:hypothetical protein
MIFGPLYIYVLRGYLHVFRVVHGGLSPPLVHGLQPEQLLSQPVLQFRILQLNALEPVVSGLGKEKIHHCGKKQKNSALNHDSFRLSKF